MNETPRANRLHISIFGRRNVGKSSLLNALTGQEMALVSDHPGTTTDPVYKSIEILPLGPCVIIDTAGLDDIGDLGLMRIKKTREVFDKTDLALLLIEPGAGVDSFELEIKEECLARKIPLLAVLNKSDLLGKDIDVKEKLEKELGLSLIPVSCLAGEGLDYLKKMIIKHAPAEFQKSYIVGDLISPGDLCILVTPIDSAAPRGRLILPQVQTIRDILDRNAQALVVKETELREALQTLIKPPKLVITDSQVFKQVAAILDEEIPLTSFSILFARYKGDLNSLMWGLKAIDELQAGDKVLIAEACTHHRQEDDIGTVKIPRLLEQKVGSRLDFHWYSGSGYPENLEDFKLIIHCGACMLNRRQMLSRIQKALDTGVPIVNYGIFLAYMNGILERSLKPLYHELKEPCPERKITADGG
ncbi:MAG: [FeFe] hydrogenase H-cluster maturation GTPase HydF [Syntrophomonadaceae bacterium]|nr:[FeFe] hydrogenase H-cluster maturation GTPase HydF [Syntrophomonadaceae bacterium]